MFKICQQQSIKFDSDKTTNKNSNAYKSTAIQTDVIKTLDKQIQSLSVDNKSIQVNLERNLIDNENFKSNFNENKLLKFLDYASNLTIHEIKESILIESDLKYIEQMNNDSEELNPLFYYSKPKLPNDNELIEKNSTLSKLTIEHIIWSSNLNQLILGFCVSEHNYWCTHNSRIEFCNLYQKSDKKPNQLKTIFKIEIKNCITTMINHPTIFTQIAVGTKSGMILIIDRELNKLNQNTSLNELSTDNLNQQCIKHVSNQHKLEITYLSFKKNNLDNNENINAYDELLSCSLDGKIIIWKIKSLDKQLQQLKLIDINKQAELTTKQIDLGIKCACLDQDYLIIANENHLYSIFLNKKLNYNSNELDFEYDKHKGEIESIELNNLNRNQFLTNAKDNEIRVYEKNQRKPLLIIYLNRNQFNFKWINLLKKKVNQFLIGLNDNNLLIINIYTKDNKYSTYNQVYSLKEMFTKLFINKANQLALINSNDEVYVFDLNVLFE